MALDSPDQRESSPPTRLVLELRVGALLADAFELKRDTGGGREVSNPGADDIINGKGSPEDEFAQLFCNRSAMALDKEAETSVELLVRR